MTRDKLIHWVKVSWDTKKYSWLGYALMVGNHCIITIPYHRISMAELTHCPECGAEVELGYRLKHRLNHHPEVFPKGYAEALRVEYPDFLGGDLDALADKER